MAYTIDDLNALAQTASGDELPIWDVSATGNEEPTKKITLQNLAAAIKTLASLLGTGDVVNDLTSTATDKPLSANMGKALNDKILTKFGTVTMATGTSNISVRQSGNTVYIGGWVSDATITANDYMKIADITGISFPPDPVRAYCNVGANAYSVGTLSYIAFDSTGGLYVMSSNGGTGKAIYFDLCYVANN